MRVRGDRWLGDVHALTGPSAGWGPSSELGGVGHYALEATVITKHSSYFR